MTRYRLTIALLAVGLVGLTAAQGPGAVVPDALDREEQQLRKMFTDWKKQDAALKKEMGGLGQEQEGVQAQLDKLAKLKAKLDGKPGTGAGSARFGRPPGQAGDESARTSKSQDDAVEVKGKFQEDERRLKDQFADLEAKILRSQTKAEKADLDSEIDAYNDAFHQHLQDAQDYEAKAKVRDELKDKTDAEKKCIDALKHELEKRLANLEGQYISHDANAKAGQQAEDLRAPTRRLQRAAHHPPGREQGPQGQDRRLQL